MSRSSTIVKKCEAAECPFYRPGPDEFNPDHCFIDWDLKLPGWGSDNEPPEKCPLRDGAILVQLHRSIK